MRKLITTILAIATIVTIVATPAFKVNSPTFKVGTTVSSNKTNSGTVISR